MFIVDVQSILTHLLVLLTREQKPISVLIGCLQCCEIVVRENVAPGVLEV